MVDSNDIKDSTNQADAVVNSDEQNWQYAFAVEQAQKLGHEGLLKGLDHIGNVRDALFYTNLALQADTDRENARNYVDDPGIYHWREDHDEKWERKVTFRPKDTKEEVVTYVQPFNAYPIIFIPDFMGSNLKDTVSGKKIWNADHRGDLAETWEHVGAYERKEKLAPGFVTVDDRGRLLEEKHTTLKTDKMKERGWGSVSYYMYGPFLAWLENQMNDFEDAERGVRAKMAQLSTTSDEPTEMGDQKIDKIDPEIQKKQESWGYDPRATSILQEQAKETTNIYTLTTDQYKQSYRYRYPVYAFGYNWMLGNIDIVQSLKNFIIDALKKEKDRIGNKGDISKVILVTHGSGGLIARKFAKDNPDLVKGVVFGAMPATGMPETYKRIKNGSNATFKQSTQQTIEQASKQTTSNFITETLFPALLDSANYAPALTASLFAWEGGPFAMLAVGSSVYAANVFKSTVLRGTINVAKEALIATDTIKDNQTIEGTTVEDVAVIAAESVGYLQTLPFSNYPTKSWLFVNLPLEKEPANYYNALQFDSYQQRQATKKPQVICYPITDPFKDIYLSSDEKGIYDEKTMNPKNSQGSTLYNQAKYTYAKSFKEDIITFVKSFQTEIKDFYPHPCYVFSGILPLSGSVSNIQSSSSTVSVKDLLPGDGVVPYVSAKPAHDAAEQSEVFCFEHRQAFFDIASRLFVVSSITKIASQKIESK